MDKVREFFGALGALAVDLRWLILGLTFGALLVARCAQVG